MSLGSVPQVARMFENALKHVLEVTDAERGVILFGEGSEEPAVRASFGFEAENFWVLAPLSLGFLREIQKTGRPVVAIDAQASPEVEARLSLIISNVRSIVCNPIWSQRGVVAGLVYVDWLNKPCMHREQILSKLQEITLSIEGFIRQIEEGAPKVEDPFIERPRAAGKPAREIVAVPKPYTRKTRAFAIPSSRAKALFLRSLTTMFGAGLPLVPCLWTLSRQRPQLAMEQVSEELARRVERGQSLSAACQEIGTFDELAVGTLRVGERTGRLHQCLELLAVFEEDAGKRRAQLQAALVYPACVLTFCLLFIALAPAAMLSAQAKMLEQLHTPLPAITTAFLALYARAYLWLPVLLLLGSPRARTGIKNLALRWGPISRVWAAFLMCQWTQSVAIPLQSGLGIVESIQLAGAASASSQLRHTSVELQQQVMDGEEFWQSLGYCRFPKLVVEMVRVGEESGTVPQSLVWLSNHYQDQLRWRIDEFTALIEPLAMVGLGLLAGALMLMTLLPMSQALEHL